MKDINKLKKQLRKRRVARVRAKVSGTAKCPRLAVFKSLKHLSVQAIDDINGKTLASVYELEVSAKGGKGKDKKEKAQEIGKLLAKKLLEQKIAKGVFDKRHYKYHGLVKEIAEGAREGGIKL